MVIHMGERVDIEMDGNEDNESYKNRSNAPPRRTKRTKLKQFDDYGEVTEFRGKRSGKRSHRRKTGKDDVWPDSSD